MTAFPASRKVQWHATANQHVLARPGQFLVLGGSGGRAGWGATSMCPGCGTLTAAAPATLACGRSYYPSVAL
jgi:hypothetical protein